MGDWEPWFWADSSTTSIEHPIVLGTILTVLLALFVGVRVDLAPTSSHAVGGRAMTVWEWFADPANWLGPTGIHRAHR
jgi:hypothetical protein